MTTECRIYIKADHPLPMTVRAVIPMLEVLN
jgi:hypothetical protein